VTPCDVGAIPAGLAIHNKHKERLFVVDIKSNKQTSNQIVGTPKKFLLRVEKLLRQRISFDLACTRENMVAPVGFVEGNQDALAEDWTDTTGLLWLNPPYKNIAPWAAKCAASKCFVAMLVPASVGSNWFRDHVYGKAMVLFLSPRLTFEGHTNPYPKDLMLCVYNAPQFATGEKFALFRWQQ